MLSNELYKSGSDFAPWLVEIKSWFINPSKESYTVSEAAHGASMKNKNKAELSWG